MNNNKTDWAGLGIGLLGGVAGRAVDGIFGIDRNAEQREQQQALTDIQEESNRRLMEESYELQQKMYDYTYNKNKPNQQIKNLKEAGLNPALMYGLGGQGGSTTGSGGTSVSGSNASDKASSQQADTMSAGMALQLAKLKSEVEVNKSIAEKNKADAGLAGEKSTTENKSRDLLIENMKQSGEAQWLQNMKEKYLMEGKNADAEINRNPIYKTSVMITEKGGFHQQVASTILKTLAEVNNIDEQAKLTSEKVQNYWKELLNETTKAIAADKSAEAMTKLSENDSIKAAATKLATEWGTGEYTNWRTWVDLSREGLKAIGDVIK